MAHSLLAHFTSGVLTMLLQPNLANEGSKQIAQKHKGSRERADCFDEKVGACEAALLVELGINNFYHMKVPCALLVLMIHHTHVHTCAEQRERTADRRVCAGYHV